VEEGRNRAAMILLQSDKQGSLSRRHTQADELSLARTAEGGCPHMDRCGTKTAHLSTPHAIPFLLCLI
jgi:hypothetical protein